MNKKESYIKYTSIALHETGSKLNNYNSSVSKLHHKTLTMCEDRNG